eukprot:scaffold14075_cov58-Phaeocystis_antarctica.AAC.3
MKQQRSSRQVALTLQQHSKVANRTERVRVRVAERRATRCQRLVEQRHSSREVALSIQQQTKVVDRTERVRVRVAERRAISPHAHFAQATCCCKAAHISQQLCSYMPPPGTVQYALFILLSRSWL